MNTLTILIRLKDITLYEVRSGLTRKGFFYDIKINGILSKSVSLKLIIESTRNAGNQAAGIKAQTTGGGLKYKLPPNESITNQGFCRLLQLNELYDFRGGIVTPFIRARPVWWYISLQPPYGVWGGSCSYFFTVTTSILTKHSLYLY